MPEFINQPAIIELFGHQVIAGHINEEEHCGTTMLRIDVPEVDGRGAFTKYFGSGAVYGITPTDEGTMLAAAGSIVAKPVSLYIPHERQLPAGGPDWDSVPDEDEEEWTN